MWSNIVPEHLIDYSVHTVSADSAFDSDTILPLLDLQNSLDDEGQPLIWLCKTNIDSLVAHYRSVTLNPQ